MGYRRNLTMGLYDLKRERNFILNGHSIKDKNVFRNNYGTIDGGNVSSE